MTSPPTTLPAMGRSSEEDNDLATVADWLEFMEMPVEGAPKIATVEGAKVVIVGITTDVVRRTG